MEGKKVVQKSEIEWLEGMMGQETPTEYVVVGRQLTCVHHVVFVSAVSGKHRLRGSYKERVVGYMIYYVKSL